MIKSQLVNRWVLNLCDKLLDTVLDGDMRIHNALSTDKSVCASDLVQINGALSQIADDVDRLLQRINIKSLEKDDISELYAYQGKLKRYRSFLNGELSEAEEQQFQALSEMTQKVWENCNIVDLRADDSAE